MKADELDGWLELRREIRAWVVGANPAPKRPTSSAPARLCAICVSRASEVEDVIDGVRVHVCRGCRDGEIAEPVDPTSTRMRVLRALARSDGLDLQELAELLDCDDETGHGALSALVNRAVKCGLMTHSGKRMDRIYAITAKGREALATARRT